MTNRLAAEESGENGLRIFGVLLPSIPGLMLRLSGSLLRFKRRVNRAGKIFEQELYCQGLDRETASRLTRAYVENGSLRHYIQMWR